MGGYGSGRRAEGLRRLRVEETLTLPVSLFKEKIRVGAAGRFGLIKEPNDPYPYRYRFTREGKELAFWIYYDSEDEQITIPIRMQKTHPNYGGIRWWFTCPLVVNGVTCHRRVGKLHLPPGRLYFGCRTCHRLSHKSSQKAHKREREIAMIAKELGTHIEGATHLLESWEARRRERLRELEEESQNDRLG